MPLMRRASREVYRVYDEDEFFADASRDETEASRDKSFQAAPRVREQRLRRVAGVTMLLTTMGAVGGLIAVSGLSAVGDRGRRVGAGLLAASGSLVSSRAAHAHVWRERVGADGSRRRRAQGRRTDRARTVRRVVAGPRADVVLGKRSAPIGVASAASVGHPAARASAAPQRRGGSEFGFER